MKPTKGEQEMLREKVVKARKALGLSLKEAAELLEFKNYQSLSAIEKGTRKITAQELSAMAELYGRSLDYFFGTEILSDPKPLWRKVGEINVKSIERKFHSFLESYSNLEALLDLRSRWKDIQKNYDKADFQERGFRLADKLGSEIRKMLNLGSRPASNLLNVLENDLRFKILHLPLPNGVSACSVVDKRLGVGILVNSEEAPWRRNFDLAHELFHVVTWNVFSHKEVGDGSRRTKPEKYADAFAASLLLPKSDLLNSLDELITEGKIKFVDIIELAKEFGVSTEAILWRLVNLEHLKKSEVERALDNPELSRIDKGLRRGLFFSGSPSKFPERYVYLACRCVVEGRISRGTFAQYLDLDRDRVDRFLKSQGFLEKTYEEIAFT